MVQQFLLKDTKHLTLGLSPAERARIRGGERLRIVIPAAPPHRDRETDDPLPPSERDEKGRPVFTDTTGETHRCPLAEGDVAYVSEPLEKQLHGNVERIAWADDHKVCPSSKYGLWPRRKTRTNAKRQDNSVEYFPDTHCGKRYARTFVEVEKITLRCLASLTGEDYRHIAPVRLLLESNYWRSWWWLVEVVLTEREIVPDQRSRPSSAFDPWADERWDLPVAVGLAEPIPQPAPESNSSPAHETQKDSIESLEFCDVPCPSCEALPGYMCRNKRTKHQAGVKSVVHRERRTASRKKARERQRDERLRTGNGTERDIAWWKEQQFTQENNK